MASKKIVGFLLAVITSFLFVFSNVTQAFALDNSYCMGERYGWMDIEVSREYSADKDGFDGFLKQIVDFDNACVYYYFHFYDPRIENCNNDQVVLVFDIKNGNDNYRLSINKDGIVSSESYGKDAFNIDYNFDNLSCRRLGGEIFVAIELVDENMYFNSSIISCEYAPSVAKSSALFTDEFYALGVVDNVVLTSGAYAPSQTIQPKDSTTAKTGAKEQTTKFKTESPSISEGDTFVYDASSQSVQSADEVAPAEEDIGYSALSIAMLISGGAFIISGAAVLVISFNKSKNKKEKIME